MFWRSVYFSSEFSTKKKRLWSRQAFSATIEQLHAQNHWKLPNTPTEEKTVKSQGQRTVQTAIQRSTSFISTSCGRLCHLARYCFTIEPVYQETTSHNWSRPFKTTPSHVSQPTKPAEIMSVQAKECRPKLNQPSQLNARVNRSKYEEKSQRAPQLKNKIFEQKRVKTWHFWFL